MIGESPTTVNVSRAPHSKVAREIDFFSKNLGSLTHLATPMLFIAMALYCVIGFTGFDLARQDEAYIFGIVLEYTRGHDWLVPLLAGRPYMEKPPLYYVLASLSVRIFTPWLAPHDAARLCSGLLIGISALCIGYASRLTWGKGYGRFAALALLCSIGLFVPAHMMLTDNAQMTGCALTLLGFASYASKKWWAGIALGTGAGFAFLSKGLLGPGVAFIAALFIMLFSRWRTRDYFFMLIIASISAAPWLLIWPTELYIKSPSLFFEWLSKNNFDRFMGSAPASLNAVKEKNFWCTKFLWGTFPTLPLALVNAKQHWKKIADQAALQIGIAFLLAWIFVLSTSATLRAIYALPVLLPLALLAAPSLRAPPPWFKLSSRMARWLFVLSSMLIWSYWFFFVVMKLDLPRYPEPSPNVGVIKADTHRHFSLIKFAVAIGITALWCICQRVWRAQAWRHAANWYGSLFCLLALFSLLCLPAVSAKSSYRHLFRTMANYLPHDGCIDSIGLGESQRGMLDYILNIETLMISNPSDASCKTLLLDLSADSALPPLGAGWSLVWRGSRSPDAHEVFYILSRDSH